MKKWERFEFKVVDALEAAGWRCVRSCYITSRDSSHITSQIDIIAVSNYGVLSVECKSHALDHLMKARYGNKLIGYSANRLIFNEDVLTQSKHHACQVYLSGITLEERLGRTFAPVHHVVVFDHVGKITKLRQDFADRILDLRSLTNADLISKLKLFRTYNDDEVTAITEYFQQFSDTSKERIEQHADYINHCMDTKTGLWDQEQFI